MRLSRRHFLQKTSRATVGASISWLASIAGSTVASKGKFLGHLPFLDEGNTPIGIKFGQGLSGRLAFDLAKIDKNQLIIPNEDFFIRTRYPDGLRASKDWAIAITGLVHNPGHIRLKSLLAKVKPMGIHLLECSGNSAYRRFGLLSAAKWSGVYLKDLFSELTLMPDATQVLIVGNDEHSANAVGSIKGASWIFPLQTLLDSGAFLASHMNGELLPKDHGQPLRLIVPNWYGCSCIKWVNEISFVNAEALPTSQMKEYAGRTHQQGSPKLAVQFQPASIDFVAMPIRVEKWLINDKINYRIIGLQWGADHARQKFLIRDNPSQDYKPVATYLASNTAWSLWTYEWKREGKGKFQIQLKARDETIRTRRLDSGYYWRTVEIG